MPQKKKKQIQRKAYWKHFIIVAVSFLIIFFLLSPYANTNPAWKEPVRSVSKDGFLETTLQAKKSLVTIGGKQAQADVYNAMYPGPVFEMKGEDTFKVHLENQLNDSTNLHFHGSHVSPKGHSDNVLLNLKPGENFDYEYHLPATHPPGLYWYHPHYHPNVEEQVLGGMAGAIIVRGDIDELPGIKDVPERLLILSTQDTNDPNNPVRLVNGQSMPTLYIRPGETQRWRVLNMSADDFYNFSIPGQKLNIISHDGNTTSTVISVDNEVIAPGDRIEILVQGGMWGTYDIKSLQFDEGFAHYPTQTFMKMVVSGFPMISEQLPTTLLPSEDFRYAQIDNTRTLRFSMGGTDSDPTFLLDGKEFNPDVVNQVLTLGTTEEWRLINESKEVHPFHIHINPFQVISVNGKPVERHGYDDTFPIPAKSEVVIRTKYTDFDGKYVLHCHILFHEDHGMMQIVEVVKPGAKQASDNGIPEREGMPMLEHLQEMLKTSGSDRYKKQNPDLQAEMHHSM